MSERLNQTTLGEAPTTTTTTTTNTSDTDDDDEDEIYTDDEDEDYEDIDSDDDYEDEDDDYDEEDEISAFIESHHHAHESRHHHHFYDQDEWDYELDRYYDDILGYNHASDFYDGIDDDIAPQWSRQVHINQPTNKGIFIHMTIHSYFANHLDIDESNRHWERFLRAMFWPNEE